MHQDAGELYVVSLWYSFVINIFQWGIIVVDAKDEWILMVEPQLRGQLGRLQGAVVVAIT